MKRIILFIGIFFCVCISAYAEDWKTFFVDSEKHKCYIDAASVVRLPGNKVRAWFYFDECEEKLWLMEIDCTQRMAKERDMLPVPGSNFSKDSEFDHDSYLKSLDEKPWNYIGTSDYENALYKTCCLVNGVRSTDPTKRIKPWVQLSDGEFKEKDEADKFIESVKATYAQLEKDHPGSKFGDENIPKIIREFDEETSIQMSLKEKSDNLNHIANLPKVNTLADILNPQSPNPGWDAPIPGIISVENVEWDNVKKEPTVIRYTKDFSQAEVAKVSETMGFTPPPSSLSFLKFPPGRYTLDIDLVKKRIRQFNKIKNN